MNEVVKEPATINMPRIGDQAPDFNAKTTKEDIELSHFAKKNVN